MLLKCNCEKKTLVDKICFGYVVSNDTAIDIDTNNDLATVRSLMMK